MHIFRCAPVWCFSFRSLFNLQGTRPTRNSHYCSRCQPSCQLLILLIFDNFRCRPAFFCSPSSRTAWLDYHMLPRFATPNFTFLCLAMKQLFSLVILMPHFVRRLYYTYIITAEAPLRYYFSQAPCALRSSMLL